jgi:hypothetical protein
MLKEKNGIRLSAKLYRAFNIDKVPLLVFKYAMDLKAVSLYCFIQSRSLCRV